VATADLSAKTRFADKSAVATINRALLLCQTAIYKLPGMSIADRKECLKGNTHSLGRRPIQRLAIFSL
jgi:hypothetical protein